MRRLAKRKQSRPRLCATPPPHSYPPPSGFDRAWAAERRSDWPATHCCTATRMPCTGRGVARGKEDMAHRETCTRMHIHERIYGVLLCHLCGHGGGRTRALRFAYVMLLDKDRKRYSMYSTGPAGWLLLRRQRRLGLRPRVRVSRLPSHFFRHPAQMLLRLAVPCVREIIAPTDPLCFACVRVTRPNSCASRLAI